MQNKSVRIRTTPGQDSNLNIEINQDFDFLEILSLRISQDDLYNSFCADYGVLVGRVITNGGFGVPNAKISVFIPISDEDERNELISQLYPYKTVIDKNSEGYRYNLFLKDTTCSINTSIGTFPTKEDLTASDIEVEVFEKYFKYTTRTNNAGDYIIFGAPTGQQEVHIDVDLSDMGIISMRPYELIEQGFPEKLFDGKTKFRSSSNLDDLPQVKTQNKGVDIVPFWGDTEVCNFGITRVDFDLGVDITPTSIFMGSIFTDTSKNALSKRCNPKNDMGEQCELDTRNGSIDILRVLYDDFENPVEIENFTPREGNEIIDENGAYAYTLPMYYDKVVTDEFGNLVKSYEPDKGIATKGKYRFKIKFDEPTIIKKRTTASLLVPSLNRIHGGTLGTEQQRWTTDIAQYLDPNNVNNVPGPTFGNKNGNPTPAPQDPNQPVPRTVESDLDLDFHTFEWKQVYTLSQFMKKFKRGGNRFSFIGAKGTDECDYNNYLPFTTAMKKASFMFALSSLFIKFIAFVIKFLIQLGNLRFCSYFRLTNNGKCRKLINAQPFKFIKNGLTDTFPNGIALPCGDNEYTIDFECAGFDSCFCLDSSNTPQPVATGGGTGSTPCCPKDGGANCQSTSCLSFNVIVPSETNCQTLNALEEWKCCAIFQSARDNKAIKFTFFDAWLNGSAYLYQFKTTVKYKSDGTIKSKFCGPGSSNYGGDNYVDFTGFGTFWTGPFINNTCSEGQCLILGPSINPADRNYVGGIVTNSSNTQNIEVPLNSPGIPNGAHDTQEFIYCNWASSTKIVSMGPMEMCEDVFSEIETCIATNNDFLSNQSTKFCNIPDLRLGDKINPYTGDNLGPLSPYNLPSEPSDLNSPFVIKVGTGGESGFDRQETTKKMPESSYIDPSVVFIYLMRQIDCKFKELFMKGSSETNDIECHELELKPEYQEIVREASKIHNDIVTIPMQDVSGNYDFSQPEVWDVTGIASQIDPNDVDGPFEVDELLYNRYHPNQQLDPNESPTNFNEINRVQVDPRTNMPYFYFGLRPGKSAINKFREKYLVQ